MQTVLIIDNCAITRECLSAILRAKGYRVQSASLISQAKTMIAKRAPDVMITEIRLPDDNALNLMRTLKGDPKLSTIKICLLTQAVSKKPIMEAIELGVNKVMLKSKFTIAGFIDQLESIIAADTASKTAPANTKDDPANEPVELRYPLPSPAGDPSKELKSIKPLISRSELKDRLDEMDNISTISESVTRVLKAIDDPETTIDQVADLIKIDQAIAMKIMRIANSSSYTRTEQTTTLKDAVLRIGLEHLRDLIISIGVIEHAIENQSQETDFNHTLFWEHAFAVAVCSSKIAEHCQDFNNELVFTAAILHDIGRVIMQQAMPEQYSEVQSTSNRLGISLELTEKRMLLVDHSSIAQTMLHSWNLPKDLIDAVANHHCPPNKLATTCPKNTQLAAVIELGNRLAHAMSLGCSGNHTISATEELFALIESPEELTLDTVTKSIQEELNGMKSLFALPGSNKDSIQTQPNTPIFDKEFKPLYITMNPETDAFGIWISQLWDGETGSKPNIIIVHVRQPKDRPELGEKITQAVAELEMNTTDIALPVLILSPTGKLTPPDEIISKHPAMHLMTPFSVLHFEETVNTLLNAQIQSLPAPSARMAA